MPSLMNATKILSGEDFKAPGRRWSRWMKGWRRRWKNSWTRKP